MNPLELLDRDGKSFGWVCGACRGQSGGVTRDRATAESCCVPPACLDCGAPAVRGWTVCRPCRDSHEAAKEATRFEKATKVPLAEYGENFVYIDGAGNDGYVDVDSLDEDLEYEPRPEYAWGVKEYRPEGDLARWVSESVLSDHYEGAIDNVDPKKLAEAQRLLDEALASIASYEPDYSVAVLLPPREDEDDTAEAPKTP